MKADELDFTKLHAEWPGSEAPTITTQYVGQHPETITGTLFWKIVP